MHVEMAAKGMGISRQPHGHIVKMNDVVIAERCQDIWEGLSKIRFGMMQERLVEKPVSIVKVGVTMPLNYLHAACAALLEGQDKLDISDAVSSDRNAWRRANSQPDMPLPALRPFERIV
jgi:hypothetical protein